MGENKLRIGLVLHNSDFSWVKEQLQENDSTIFSFYQIKYDLYSKNLSSKADVVILDPENPEYPAFDKTKFDMNIPLIILINSVSDENLISAIENHPYDIWIKDKTPQDRMLRSIQKIIDKKQTSRELELFKTVVEFMPISVIISNIDGDIEYVNPQFENVSGYSFAELIDRNPRILKSGVHNKQFYEDMWKTLGQGLAWEGEIYNKNKNGQLYLERLMIFPYKDEDGRITNYIGLRIDDTDRRKAEALRHIKELAGGIAHEFSQPLQVITISMSMLEPKVQKNELYARIQRMVDKIVKLVDNLKNITELKQQDYLDMKILDLKASSSSEKTNRSHNNKNKK
ncbi:MAG: PAS domain S-box protein [Calditrichaceae bacterium]